jgi:hypothetical protein
MRGFRKSVHVQKKMNSAEVARAVLTGKIHLKKDPPLVSTVKFGRVRILLGNGIEKTASEGISKRRLQKK